MSDKPPFKLVDNDPASHLWVMGETMRSKYKLPTASKYMKEYAERIKALEEDGAAMLAALKRIASSLDIESYQRPCLERTLGDIASAAIDKAEGRS